MNELIRLGNLYGFTGGSFAGNVYDPKGICPAINTCGGGNREPMIIEIGNVVIDDTYIGRPPRVYNGVSPTLRSERSGFKTIVSEDE